MKRMKYNEKINRKSEKGRTGMDNYGFIHDRLDIKILILFVLRRLPGTVDPETLLEICQ